MEHGTPYVCHFSSAVPAINLDLKTWYLVWTSVAIGWWLPLFVCQGRSKHLDVLGWTGILPRHEKFFKSQRQLAKIRVLIGAGVSLRTSRGSEIRKHPKVTARFLHGRWEKLDCPTSMQQADKHTAAQNLICQ